LAFSLPEPPSRKPVRGYLDYSEKTVEGLVGKSGATLKVTYREEGANRIATRIDVSEAKK